MLRLYWVIAQIPRYKGILAAWRTLGERPSPLARCYDIAGATMTKPYLVKFFNTVALLYVVAGLPGRVHHQHLLIFNSVKQYQVSGRLLQRGTAEAAGWVTNTADDWYLLGEQFDHSRPIRK